MDYREAISILKTWRVTGDKEHESLDMAISALQAQDSETRKNCDTCKYDPPSKKWPCTDCDMRDPADRWEPKDVPGTNVGDMVSRRAVLEINERYHGKMPNEINHKIWREIKELPSAQPEQRWIPCSERLPDMWDERYLVSLAWGSIGVMEYKSTGFHNYGSFTPVPIKSITAWMPLPEPYAERRTDDVNDIT